MIELRTLEGERVCLVSTSGEIYEGKVGDYIFPDDNEPEGIEGVILECPIRGNGRKCKYLMQFNATDIKSIEVIS